MPGPGSAARTVDALAESGLALQVADAARGPYLLINGRSVLNFATTNYLGLSSHPALLSAAAAAFRAYGLSLAAPRILATDRLTVQLELALARLVGQEAALVFASTTHAAHDVLAHLAGPSGYLFIDAGAYPISRAAAHAVSANIHTFPHNDLHTLSHVLAAHTHAPQKVIVCDGVYAEDGRPAPLRSMADLANRHHATIYVDDAHGLGLLGAAPTPAMPYGFGGGGTPAHAAAPAAAIAHVGSLSKALGVPLAFVAGPGPFIERLRRSASSHIHASPPAVPIVAAALAALELNAVSGDNLRQRLLQHVRHFRRGLGSMSVLMSLPPRMTGNPDFPIQTLRFATPAAGVAFAARVRRAGVWPVLQLAPPNEPFSSAVRFVVTARHTTASIDAALEVISSALTQSTYSRSVVRAVPA